MMEKRLTEVEIAYCSYGNPINLGDIKKLVSKVGETLLDDDIILQGLDEDYIRYEVSILRPRMETDQEFEKRKEQSNRVLENLKECRRLNYIKLKKEFENE